MNENHRDLKKIFKVSIFMGGGGGDLWESEHRGTEADRYRRILTRQPGDYRTDPLYSSAPVPRQ